MRQSPETRSWESLNGDTSTDDGARRRRPPPRHRRARRRCRTRQRRRGGSATKIREKETNESARASVPYTIQSLFADSLALICDRNGEEVIGRRRDDVGLSPSEARYERNERHGDERTAKATWGRYFRKRRERERDETIAPYTVSFLFDSDRYDGDFYDGIKRRIIVLRSLCVNVIVAREIDPERRIVSNTRFDWRENCRDTTHLRRVDGRELVASRATGINRRSA